MIMTLFAKPVGTKPLGQLSQVSTSDKEWRHGSSVRNLAQMDAWHISQHKRHTRSHKKYVYCQAESCVNMWHLLDDEQIYSYRGATISIYMEISHILQCCHRRMDQKWRCHLCPGLLSLLHYHFSVLDLHSWSSGCVKDMKGLIWLTRLLLDLFW